MRSSTWSASSPVMPLLWKSKLSCVSELSRAMLFATARAPAEPILQVRKLKSRDVSCWMGAMRAMQFATQVALAESNSFFFSKLEKFHFISGRTNLRKHGERAEPEHRYYG